MWHQKPRASVCYYKWLLLPHSHLYTLKLETGDEEIPACFYHYYYYHLFSLLTADEGNDDIVYVVIDFKSSRSSIYTAAKASDA